MNHLGKNLKEEYYNGSESVRTFKCETGSGCAPDSNGSEIKGTFADGKRAGSKAMKLKRLKSKEHRTKVYS